MLLIFGGFDTTRNQLGLAMQTFLAHPDQWRLLAQRPGSGRQGRRGGHAGQPTTRWVTREVIEDLENEGLLLPHGTTVHPTPNRRDRRRVFEPGFDITAERKPHFGFARGALLFGTLRRPRRHERALPPLARRMTDPA